MEHNTLTSGRAGLRARLLQGSIASVALRMFNLSVNLVVTVVLARLLAPSGYGVYSLVLAIVSLLAVPIQLGLPTLVLREVALYREHRQWALLRGLLQWSHKIILSMAIVIGLATVAVAWALRIHMDREFFPTVLAAAPLLAVAALTSVRQSTLMGLGRVVLAQVPELLFLPVIYLGCLLHLWLFATSAMLPQSAMVAYVGCYGTSFVLGSILLKGNLPTGIREIHPITHQRAWLKSIFPLSFISGLTLINSQVAILVLGCFSTDENVGLYRVAASGAALATVVGATIGGFVSPHVATLHDRGEHLRLQKLAKYSAWACLIPALIALTTFVTIGDRILGQVFGPRFVAAAGALVILTIGQVVNCATGIVHSLLNMTGYARDTLRGAILGATTSLALSLLLVPHFGLIGASTATCIAVAAENLLLYVSVRTRLNIGSSVFSIGSV